MVHPRGRRVPLHSPWCSFRHGRGVERHDRQRPVSRRRDCHRHRRRPAGHRHGRPCDPPRHVNGRQGERHLSYVAAKPGRGDRATGARHPARLRCCGRLAPDPGSARFDLAGRPRVALPTRPLPEYSYGTDFHFYNNRYALSSEELERGTTAAGVDNPGGRPWFKPQQNGLVYSVDENEICGIGS